MVKEKGGRAVWVTGGAKKTGSSEKKPVIQRPGKRPIKRPARHLSDEESPDEQETLGTCFKDSDYGEQHTCGLTSDAALINASDSIIKLSLIKLMIDQSNLFLSLPILGV